MMGLPTLETFFEEIRSSCDEHARRKGYLQSGRNVLGDIMQMTNLEGAHAAGEVITKVLEYTRVPRRVLAVKVAGWAWRMWLAAEKD